ncbi:YciI family protein [Janibacter sp. G56]|uniref:YciI family protein n=1 Tax=Janibacter sp. G56 TaxID=3418717 RepID=UPI003D08C983
MTQYMISVIGSTTDATPAPEDMERLFAQVGAFNDDVKAKGHWVFAGGLQPIEDATVVDATGDDVVMTDGPFAESKEFIGGFWVIEAPDLDVALELAARGSKACEGKVEVRPFQSDDVELNEGA